MQLKKVLAIVLSVVMILGVMPFAAFAATVEVANGAALKTAVASASSGDVIAFNADNTEYPATSGALVIPVDGKDITIDLNGHTQYFRVSGETTISYFTDLFVLMNGAKLTVTDSQGGGAIYATYGGNSAAYMFNVTDSSELVINGGKFVMDAANYGGVIVYQNDATASTTINDGEFTANTGAKARRDYLINNTRGEVEINGGEFTTARTFDYVISEGNTTDTKLTINDGEFNGTMSLDVTKADTELNGGTYLTNDGAVNTAVSAYLPADQIIDSTTGEIKDVDASTVARTNSGEFETLAAALASVGAGETATITLLADCTLASTTEIADNQKITINLNGNDITCPARVFNIRHGQLTISGTGNLNATFTGANAAVAVYGAATDNGSNYSTFTLSTPAVINAPNGYGAMIGANSGAAYGAKLQLGGTINSKYGVYINGNVAEPEVKTNAAAINITGTVTAGNDNSVVYAAGYAKWNIYSNANLTGGSGVYIKSGTMNIYGNAVITATGAKTDYKFNTNGCDATGDAIIIDSCGYPGNVPTVTIKAGTITSANGEAVASYAKQDDPLYPTAEFPRVDNVIPATSTAVFSSDVTALAAEGYETVYDAEAGGYVVAEDTHSVAIVGDQKFDTLAAAIEAASAGDTVKLLRDATVNTGSSSSSRLAISKSLTIDGDNHTISINNRGFGVGMNATAPVDVTFKDVTIINSSTAGRCVDTRGNLNSLTLDNATLKTTGTSGYLQPLTIGGNQSSTATVNVINSTIQTSDDGSKGYAIITFNPVDMTITNSTIKGWACIYAKGVDGSAGSAGSTFTVSGSTLVSKNPHSGATNAFGTLVVEDSDIDFNITNCNISIDGEANKQYLFTNNVEYVKDYVDPDAEIENVTVALGEGNNVELKAMGEFAVDATDDVTLVISGGTFSAPVPVEYCAHSYKANYDDEAGAYVVEQQAAPNNGANITIKDTITENFYLDEHFYPAGAVVTKEYNKNTNVSQTPNVVTETVAMSALPKLDDASSDYDGCSIISITQAPAQITEDIIIKVYANADDAAAGTNVLKEITYNTRDYCEAVIAGDYTTAEKDLAKATLDYAAAAQIYFGYNTDDMAADSFYGAVEEANLSAYRGFYEKASGFKYVTITATSDLAINFLSNVDFDVTDYSIGTESGVDRFAVANTGKNGDYYVANVSGLVPANFDEIIRIETSEGNLEFTANTVLEVISRSSNANYATLAKAMFLYGVAANAYFG